MKRGLLLFFCIIALIIGVGVGILTNEKRNKSIAVKEEKNIVISKKTENELDRTNKVSIETNSKQTKIGLKTKLVMQKNYKACGHTINTYVEIPSEMINMTEDELKKDYPDWTIQKFTEEEVILLRNEEGYCNEHYLIKDIDGQVVVFNIDSSENEKVSKETGISTNFLPQQDKLNLKEGIKVYGIEELNKTLEDYE